ncbi:MAG: hypothetical protein KVP17_003901 [Porospora cf. gigantea B]|uniref:uncharacterized protein n=1 Tax=Porospora cf. gigantea B TaxID=2853592 RepID=UPI0035719622|nr:MAG: hypothetical protein KVP17_003901 [Porospora cf. gigantea B]
MRQWLLIQWTRSMDYHESRFAEIEGLLSVCKPFDEPRWRPDRQDQRQGYPFDYCYLSLEEAAFILNNSVLVKSIVHVWFDCPSYEDLRLEAELNPPADLRPLIAPPDKTFSFMVDAYNRKTSAEYCETRRTELTTLFAGDEIADLNDPKEVIWLWEVHDQDGTPVRCFLGYQVAKRKLATRHLGFWYRYRLPKRLVLGPTTLDHELAFIMCNAAGVTSRSVVYDPFCGTGSLLIAAADRGAMVLGSDMDIRVLKGYSCSRINRNIAADAISCVKRRRLEPSSSHSDPNTPKADRKMDRSIKDLPSDIFRNFTYYGLGAPDGVVRLDSIGDRPIIRDVQGGLVDVILTDPPYGIRAGAKVTGRHDGSVVDAQKVDTANYIPPWKTVSTSEIFQGLLRTAARLLKPTGAMVSLLPVKLESSGEELGDFEARSNEAGFKMFFTALHEMSGGTGRFIVGLRRSDCGND